MQTRFAYRRSADQGRAPAHRPVVVVGAGPVGLTLAVDLALRGVPVVVLDKDDTLASGSRAICFAKRSLEIFDRLGIGERMVAKGVAWNVGRVFLRDQPVYRFDLLPETGHERPAFINLQQFYVEGYLVERAAGLPAIDLRWKNEVTAIAPHAGGATLTVQTPDGPYTLQADWVVACDGSRSPLRRLLGLEARGCVCRDRFLIVDITMDLAHHPAERWFWFDPPFHPGRSVLLHKQPDGGWRIDFQLGWDADPELEKRPERIRPRVQALLAHSPAMRGLPFEIGWASVYTFACRRMASFRHGRVFFAGDSAHALSPFGARGANSGIQDADNLGWKLAAVLHHQAGDTLLASYGAEREAAADENIAASRRSTDFITPKSEASRLLRDAVLQLAKTQPFARTLVNSGRLSVPATLHGSPLVTPAVDATASRMVPGAAAADAPIMHADGTRGWLLRALGNGFAAIYAGPAAAARACAEAARGLVPLKVLALGDDTLDVDGALARRYDLAPGGLVLLRPDQHVCARWRAPAPEAVRAAIRRALALP